MHIQDNNAWNFNSSYKALRDEFGDRIYLNRSLSDFTTFATGGPARLFAEIDSTETLSKLLKLIAKFRIPLFLLGGGSNLLVSDSGFNGIVIRNVIKGMELSGDRIICGAGENLEDLVNYATKNKLTGLEFASGIYGTVGGAIFGNAGAYGNEIGDILLTAELVDINGNISNVPKEKLGFGYRTSALKQSRDIVTMAVFALKNGIGDDIQCKVDDILAKRKAKLPYQSRTAGCVFKNIPKENEEFGKLSAGRLLEEAGAKSLRIGSVRVYEKHANILVNEGEANSDDIIRLTQLMKKMVFDKFGIELEEEIILLGSFKEDRL